MAITSVISNTVTDPNGKVVAGAVIVVTLYTAVGVGGGFRIDDATEVSPVTSTVTNASGVWSLALERQANINPANSYYIVQEFLPSAVGDPYSPQGVRSWLFQVGATNQALSAALVTQPPAGVATAFLTQAQGDLRYVLAPGTFAGTVTSSAPGDVGNAGVLSAYSRGDHKHGREAITSNWQCSVNLASAAFSIPAGVATAVVFDTSIEDPSSMYSVGTGNFTVPAGAGGRWLINAVTSLSSGPVAGTTYAMVGQPAGTEKLRGVAMGMNNVTNPGPAVAGILRLAAGVTFNVMVFQNSAGAVNMLGGRPYARCEVQYLGA